MLIYILIFLDQFLKYIAVNVKINNGMIYGILSGYWTNLVIIVLSITLFFLYKVSYKPIIFAEFFFAGVLSNSIDRIIHGGVIDIFDFSHSYFTWFNLADIYISLFTILIYIYYSFRKRAFKKII